MKLVALLLAVLLSGCAATANIQQAASQPDPIAGALQLAVPDVQGALQLAQAADDKAAVQCWTALLPHIRELGAYHEQAQGISTQGGLATAYQRLRNGRRFVTQHGWPDVDIACSAMVNSSTAVLTKLLGILGVPIPSLPL